MTCDTTTQGGGRLHIHAQGALTTPPKPDPDRDTAATFILDVTPDNPRHGPVTLLVTAYDQLAANLLASHLDTGDPLTVIGEAWLSQRGALVVKAHTLGWSITDQPLPLEDN